MAQGVNDQIGIQSLLRTACDGLPRDRSTRLKRRLHNALVGIWFVDCVLRTAREAVIPDIIRLLEKVGRKTEGALSLTDYASFRPIVRRLTITRRGEFAGPCFYVAAGGSFGDPIVERVREKFLKKYDTSAPIELLAFYQLQPVAPDALWLPQLREFAISNLGRSPFRRVWVYDVVEHTVRYMYPFKEKAK